MDRVMSNRLALGLPDTGRVIFATKEARRVLVVGAKFAGSAGIIWACAWLGKQNDGVTNAWIISSAALRRTVPPKGMCS